MVGKNAIVPEGVNVGRNVVIHPFADAKAFGRRKNIASGSDIGKNMR